MLALLIVVITYAAPDLSLIEQAYSESLNYRVVDRGAVVEEMASAWGAPRMAGRDFVLMQPESNADFYLRFVQSDAIDGYAAMKTFGWNATEILVQDPDELAKQFRGNDSKFRIVGEPRPLSATSPIRAMQVVGPAEEVVYLTRIPPPDAEGGNPDRAGATTWVDRPFIVILGGPDLDAMRNFYKEQFGFQVSDGGMARMTVLNKAHGFDIERTHPIAMARISPEFAIEIDGYPETATTRAHRYEELPPSMAMIGFEVSSLEPFRSQLLGPAQSQAAKPYGGRKIGVIRGPADELIELIETP